MIAETEAGILQGIASSTRELVRAYWKLERLITLVTPGGKQLSVDDFNPDVAFEINAVVVSCLREAIEPDLNDGLYTVPELLELLVSVADVVELFAFSNVLPNTRLYSHFRRLNMLKLSLSFAASDRPRSQQDS